MEKIIYNDLKHIVKDLICMFKYEDTKNILDKIEKLITKYKLEKQKNCTSMIISEIPFEVVKSSLVARIDKARVDKEVEGIIEVRDESDRKEKRKRIVEQSVEDVKDLINRELTVIVKKEQTSTSSSSGSSGGSGTSDSDSGNSGGITVKGEKVTVQGYGKNGKSSGANH